MQLDPGLLAAIIERPDDDLPRLICADFWQERGEEERAEFVRIQISLAEKFGDGKRCYACGWTISHDGRGCGPEGDCSFRPSEHTAEHGPWLTRMHELAALRRRERELLNSGPHFRNELTWAEPCDIVARIPGGVIFRRGFVEELTCTWSDWTRHADAIRAATPLRRVRLTTWTDDANCVLNDDQRYPGIEFELPQQYRLQFTPDAPYALRDGFRAGTLEMVPDR